MIRILSPRKGDEVVETLPNEKVMEMLQQGYNFYEDLGNNNLGDNVKQLDEGKDYLVVFPMQGG